MFKKQTNKPNPNKQTKKTPNQIPPQPHMLSSAGALNFPWNVLPWQFISFIASVLAETQIQQYYVYMDNEDSIYNC